MNHRYIRPALRAFPLALLLAALAVSVGQAQTGRKLATYGADLSQAQRQELAALFQADAATQTAVISTQDMLTTLQGTGLPVAVTDQSISSSVLTCLNRGDGLTVRTQNITRIPAPVYANAMVTAGVGDANVLIAAPQANPVTGETALVGVLRSYPQCQAGVQPDQGRINLAYEQVARTIAIAGPNGDLTRASTALLQAAQPVITGQATTDVAIDDALQAALQQQGIQLQPAQRAEQVAFLRKLNGLDYGTYARGYQLQQVSPTEVRVLPAGAGAPGAAQSQGQGAGAGAAQPPTQATVPAGSQQANPAGAAVPGAGRFNGEVVRTGDALTVRVDGADRPVAAAPNVVVTRDGRDANLADIEQGDSVAVTTGADGSPQRIDATSADDGGGSVWRWLIPLLLALLVLGALLWFLLGRRRRDNFILEPEDGRGSTA